MLRLTQAPPAERPRAIKFYYNPLRGLHNSPPAVENTPASQSGEPNTGGTAGRECVSKPKTTSRRKAKKPAVRKKARSSRRSVSLKTSTWYEKASQTFAINAAPNRYTPAA